MGARTDRAGVIRNAVAGIDGDIQKIAGASSEDQDIHQPSTRNVENGLRRRFLVEDTRSSG